jgi:hypothetical protein
MSLRMCRAALQKAERGQPQWKRAFGYLGDTYQPDPKTAPLVQQAYAALLAGSSLNDIARLFNDAGAHGLNGKPWSPTTVSLFLRAPRNAGLRAHNGVVVGAGSWPGLVPEATWKSAQAVLNAPGRAPGRKTVKRHLLTGVLQCGNPGCGGYLSGQHVAHKTGGKSGRPKAGQAKEPHPGHLAHRITYGCKRCFGCNVRGEYVEPLVYELVTQRLAEPDAEDLLKAEVHDEVEAERLRAERMTLLARLDEIADERADGLLTGAQAKRATERVTAKLADIDRAEQDAERLRVFADLPLGTPEVADAVRRLSPDRLRAVLDVLAVITVAPVGKGHRVDGKRFDRDRVQVTWK